MVPALCEEIENWRGLAFKQPVAVTFTNETDREKLAGFYDSESKRLVVKLHRGRARFSRGVLLHELVHALQDQHFDLARLHTNAAAVSADAERALSCLIEGEAILAVAELMNYDFAAHSDLAAAKGEMEEERFDKLFTYGRGFELVKHLRADGGWAAVTAAFANPPRSTGVVLNPAGYDPAAKPGPAQRRRIDHRRGRLRRGQAAGTRGGFAGEGARPRHRPAERGAAGDEGRPFLDHRPSAAGRAHARAEAGGTRSAEEGRPGRGGGAMSGTRRRGASIVVVGVGSSGRIHESLLGTSFESGGGATSLKGSHSVAMGNAHRPPRPDPRA